jgi:hypothetical protein
MPCQPRIIRGRSWVAGWPLVPPRPDEHRRFDCLILTLEKGGGVRIHIRVAEDLCEAVSPGAVARTCQSRPWRLRGRPQERHSGADKHLDIFWNNWERVSRGGALNAWAPPPLLCCLTPGLWSEAREKRWRVSRRSGWLASGAASHCAPSQIVPSTASGRRTWSEDT